jgi:hypothetical protein
VLPGGGSITCKSCVHEVACLEGAELQVAPVPALCWALGARVPTVCPFVLRLSFHWAVLCCTILALVIQRVIVWLPGYSVASSGMHLCFLWCAVV